VKLIFSEKVDQDKWNSLVKELGGNLYHSYQWGEINRTTKKYPLYFQYQDEKNRCIGLALGIVSKPKQKYIGRFFKKIDFNSNPVILDNNEDIFKEMVKDIFIFCEKKKFLSLRIDSYYSKNSVYAPNESTVKANPRIEFILDLKKTEEELWNNMKSSHRRKVKNGIKNDLSFIEDKSVDGVIKLRSLQIESRDRKIEQGDYYEIGRVEDYIRMRENLLYKDNAKLFFVKRGEELLSGALFILFNQKVFYLLGGTSSKGFESDASPFLFWNAILHFKKEGFTEFNFGGVPREAENPSSQSFGLYRFKDGFGGKKVYCCGWENLKLNKFRDILLKILKKVAGFKLFTVEKYNVYRKDLSLPDPEINCPIDLEIREAKKEEIENFKNMPPPFPRHYEYYAIHGLRHCYLGLHKGKLVFIGWIKYPEEFQNFVLKLRKLKPTEAHPNHFFTLESYRGKNIYTKVMNFFSVKLRSEGFTHLIGTIPKPNLASIKGIKKSGFKEIGKVYYLKMFWNKRGKGFYFRRMTE